MTNDKNHIDNYFTEGLTNLEVTPPPDVWKNVEKHLDNKRRGRIIGIWSAMAAGLALLIGIGTYLKSDIQTNPSQRKQNSIVSLPDKSTNNQALAPENATTQLQNKGLESATTEAPPDRPVQNQTINKATLNNNYSIQDSSNFAFSEPPTIEGIGTLISNRADSTPRVIVNNQSIKPNSIFLTPFGAHLNTSILQNQVVQPENIQVANNTNLVEPLLPEVADNTEVKKMQRWSISGQVAPLYSYRTSNQNLLSGQNQEKGLVAYSGGIKVDYKTNRRLSIQAGVFYSVMGQVVENVNINAYQIPQSMVGYGNSFTNVVVTTSNSMGPISNSSNAGNNSDKMYANFDGTSNSYYAQNSMNLATNKLTNTNNGSIVQKLKFIEIPLLARFKIIDKKISVHILGGVGTNFLVNNSAILKQDGNSEKIGQTQGLNTINYSSTVGFGINYFLAKNIDLSIEPTYKFYLNSISSYQNNEFRPYSFGLFTGLLYKF